jgi:hypothetical protein
MAKKAAKKCAAKRAPPIHGAGKTKQKRRSERVGEGLGGITWDVLRDVLSNMTGAPIFRTTRVSQLDLTGLSSAQAVAIRLNLGYLGRGVQLIPPLSFRDIESSLTVADLANTIRGRARRV